MTKKIIKIVVIWILLFTGLILIFNKVLVSNHIEKVPLKENNIEDDYEEYICSSIYNEKRKQENNGIYIMQAFYEFSFDASGIRCGKSINEFTFTNKNDYDNFSYSDFNANSSLTAAEENLYTLRKTYELSMTIPSESNNIDEYLKKLNEYGYTCELK